MDNQHKLIKGYRDLSQEEIDMMNLIKNDLGTKLENMIDEVWKLENSDKRWIAIAKTDFQTGLMALVRAIARPDSF